MSIDAGLVRITVHVAGAKVEDVSFPASNPGGVVRYLGDRHGRITARAADEGKPWLVDVGFPDGEHVRFGTDAEGMVWPVEVGLDEFVRKLSDLP